LKTLLEGEVVMTDDERQRVDEEQTAGPDTGDPAPAPEPLPAHGSVRYTRRRVLILGGAFAAGVAAVIAGLRAFGGSAADQVGGAITDQFGSFPVRSVDPVPDVPPDEWVVKVDGLVDEPLTIDRTAWGDLQRMNETADFHCVEGWGVDDVRWGGVAPTVLLDQAGVKPGARYAIFHAYGGVYLSTLPLELIRDSKTMLADSLNGQPLPPKHGGPLRLVVPKQLGYKNVKWVERIELSDRIRTGYWEANGYPEDAPVLGS
jgi:DMSO/TMAO reductase YedYZ molybdopterin-dependent catalytic subunit